LNFNDFEYYKDGSGDAFFIEGNSSSRIDPGAGNNRIALNANGSSTNGEKDYIFFSGGNTTLDISASGSHELFLSDQTLGLSVANSHRELIPITI